MQSSREERKAVNLGSVPLGGDPEERLLEWRHAPETEWFKSHIGYPSPRAQKRRDEPP